MDWLREQVKFFDAYSVVFNGKEGVLSEFAGIKSKDELPEGAKKIESLSDLKSLTKGNFEVWVEMVKTGLEWNRSGDVYIIQKERR